MPRRNLNLIFIVLIFLTLVLFIFSKLQVLNFAGNFVQNIFAPFESAARNIFIGNSSDLQKENIELAKKLVDQQKLIQDNKALRDQFQTSGINTQNLTAASIIGSPSFIPGVSNPENLILDKGVKNGVRKGQAVIYKDNLIGIIKKSNDNYSIVATLGLPSFSLTAKTQNDASGIIRGQDGGQIILENVLLSERISKNDLVVTLGNINEGGFGVLPNLIIGKIVSVNKNASSLFQTAKIEPLIDISTLSTVFIVIN
ncbi:MAG: hypothetical protein A3B38_02635 [Candidatus Levybacteria bacterium RIFCSPLOWO2_01_FULL_36_13]|nr:MAG: hypothetical protein A2684_03830 [Candidatus Levybacteria bacterium RIFCSPHIGHO2_01_FULL_36_15b]OGH35174.1 MAG: hypothetical protein A3B38_02635 [Candidatus Levybacteria bacterium RIFCSPLOWO2_01_FULL_36_13]